MASSDAQASSAAVPGVKAQPATTIDLIMTDIRAEADRHKARIESLTKLENERYSRRLERILERLASLGQNQGTAAESSLVRRKRNRSSTVSARSDRSDGKDKSDNEEADEDDKDVDEEDVPTGRVNKVSRTSEVVASDNKTPRRKSALKCYVPNASLDPSKRCLFVPKSGGNAGLLCNFERSSGHIFCDFHYRRSKNFLNTPLKNSGNKLRNLPRETALQMLAGAGINNGEHVLDTEVATEGDACCEQGSIAGAISVADAATLVGAERFAGDATTTYEAASEAGTMVTAQGVRRNSALGSADLVTSDTISVASRVQAVHSRVSGETAGDAKRGGKGRKVSSKKATPVASAANATAATTDVASVNTAEQTAPQVVESVSAEAAAAATDDTGAGSSAFQHPFGVVKMPGLPDGCLYDMKDKFVLEYMGNGKYKAILFVPDTKNPTAVTELNERHKTVARERGYLLLDKSVVHGVIPDVSSESRSRARAPSPSAMSSATTSSLSRQVVFMSLEQAQSMKPDDVSIARDPSVEAAQAAPVATGERMVTAKRSTIANKRVLSAGSVAGAVKLVPGQNLTNMTQAELKEQRERIERGKNSPGILTTPGTKHGVPLGSVMTPSIEDTLPMEMSSL